MGSANAKRVKITTNNYTNWKVKGIGSSKPHSRAQILLTIPEEILNCVWLIEFMKLKGIDDSRVLWFLLGSSKDVGVKDFEMTIANPLVTMGRGLNIVYIGLSWRHLWTTHYLWHKVGRIHSCSLWIDPADLSLVVIDKFNGLGLQVAQSCRLSKGRHPN